jgi:hypothetical protein
VRKHGYLPSTRTARRLVSCIRVVLQWTDAQASVASELLCSGFPEGSWLNGEYVYSCIKEEQLAARSQCLSGSDYFAIKQLLAWWSISDDCEDVNTRARVYVIVDLNSGSSLCVVSSRDVGASESHSCEA